MIHLKKSRKGCGRYPVASPLRALSPLHWPDMPSEMKPLQTNPACDLKPQQRMLLEPKTTCDILNYVSNGWIADILNQSILDAMFIFNDIEWSVTKCPHRWGSIIYGPQRRTRFSSECHWKDCPYLWRYRHKLPRAICRYVFVFKACKWLLNGQWLCNHDWLRLWVEWKPKARKFLMQLFERLWF